MSLKVIDFIKENLDWREILAAEPYHISIVEDGSFIILKYSQIDSDFHNDIVRECRGLIIDNDFKPVCVPFFKFGNYGEPYADEIDWLTAKVEEKIDGSLIKVWNYKGEWLVSTNGTIFAEKARISSEQTSSPYKNFRELFNAAAEISGLNFSLLSPQYTYMFELVSPYNRIVVPYDSPMIYHIGTRDNLTLKEIEIDIGIQKPKVYDCGNLNDLIEMASNLRYCEEGYVIKDKDYKRIKVKSPAYVSVHHLIDGLSDKRLIELLRTNEISEFLTYFPEYEKNVHDLKERINEIVRYINDVLSSEVVGKVYETRKDFALFALETKFPAFFFAYYDNKAREPCEWIWRMTSDKILEMLDGFRKG